MDKAKSAIPFTTVTIPKVFILEFRCIKIPPKNRDNNPNAGMVIGYIRLKLQTRSNNNKKHKNIKLPTLISIPSTVSVNSHVNPWISVLDTPNVSTQTQ